MSIKSKFFAVIDKDDDLIDLDIDETVAVNVTPNRRLAEKVARDRCLTVPECAPYRVIECTRVSTHYYQSTRGYSQRVAG